MPVSSPSPVAGPVAPPAAPRPRSLTHRLAAECLGTGLLILLGPGAVMVAASTGAFGPGGISLTFGLVVMLLVATLGPVSGAHINPSVTMMFWVLGKTKASEVVPYIAAQCAGAVVAALSLRALLGPVGNLGATVPAVGLVEAGLIEAGYSAILAFVILRLTTDAATPPVLIPLGIGATVGVGALVTGPLTGGSFNPARSLGPAVAGGIWTAHWLYWIAPTLGMLLGGWLGLRMGTAAPAGDRSTN